MDKTKTAIAFPHLAGQEISAGNPIRDPNPPFHNLMSYYMLLHDIEFEVAIV